ncbi:acetyl-coenzyme A carboxylase carboxyl transferase subunit beta, chloroplastic-like [Vicia villosa]|uniref:acetyl-coenzyme A carboxylase carboxyl transferase subunit beta, chloroplastic-like n=1 Tax=Vicia villosa TaxID=3911 RepID=UPI00273BD41D|nr:acetyl-coenzyme A carboxylase carboxyl transferase subunit beta, chloroplastic-like [Vicia villosa]
MTLNLCVLTPNRIVWDSEVKEIILSTNSGQIGVLKNHAPIATALDIGILRIRLNDRCFASYQNSSYLTNVSKSNDPNDTWNDHINGWMESYLRSQICFDSSILDDSDFTQQIENDSDFPEIEDYDYDNGNEFPEIEDYDYDNGNEFPEIEDYDYDFPEIEDYDYDNGNEFPEIEDYDYDFPEIEDYDYDNGNEFPEVESESDLTQIENDNDSDFIQIKKEFVPIVYDDNTSPFAQFDHLWDVCDTCYAPNYKEFLKSNLHICECCGDYLKMSSSDRIELLIDPGTWNPMDEDMVSLDPIEFDSEEEFHSEEEIGFYIESDLKLEPLRPMTRQEVKEFNALFNMNLKYKGSDEEEEEEEEEEEKEEDKEKEEWEEEDEPYQNRLDSLQEETGLPDAVETGTGQLNGIPVAIGIMDFRFLGGSMGSVVGEKITRLIEYATNQLLPLIIVCASGGARMQEGSISLMQMAKISSALYNYQINKKLFYVAILTSPTTGGVIASFGMLGDIVIAEPNACIAFAGKRVIEETLNLEVPEGSQSADFLFEKGLFDSIVPRNLLKEVLSELFQFHGLCPLTENEN